MEMFIWFTLLINTRCTRRRKALYIHVYVYVGITVSPIGVARLHRRPPSFSGTISVVEPIVCARRRPATDVELHHCRWIFSTSITGETFKQRSPNGSCIFQHFPAQNIYNGINFFGKTSKINS